MRSVPLVLAAAVALAASLLGSRAPARAAAAPEVTSVMEGRDTATDRAVLVLLGKNLTKFTAFSLTGPGGTPALPAPDLMLKAKTMVVLGLPPGTDPGKYEVHATPGAGTPVTLGVQVLGGIDAQPWADADGDAVKKGGKVGIGTTTPATSLHVEGKNGVVFLGEFGEGVLPVEGPGTRFLWSQSHGALRAGTSDGDEWDEGSIGDNSFASGLSCTASGPGSAAFGQQSEAVGAGSLALGFKSTAYGDRSVAMGAASLAKAENSFAQGFDASASGKHSVAFGESTRAASYAGLALGRFNVYGGEEGTWSGIDAVLSVGNGKADDNRSDAMTLMQNGDLTIAGTLTEKSDARMKTDVAPLSGVLSRLAKVHGVTYRFRDGVAAPAGRHIGLLAQEVRAEFPELVEEGRDGTLSVAYGKFGAVLLEALHEQQARIETLEKELAALRK